MSEELSVPVNDQIESLEKELLNLPQVECPLKHNFAPGVYMREITMPAGSFIIGHEHLTEHFNVVLTGKARVMIDGVIEDLVAPCYFISKPNVRKVLFPEPEGPMIAAASPGSMSMAASPQDRQSAIGTGECPENIARHEAFGAHGPSAP